MTDPELLPYCVAAIYIVSFSTRSVSESAPAARWPGLLRQVFSDSVEVHSDVPSSSAAHHEEEKVSELSGSEIRVSVCSRNLTVKLECLPPPKLGKRR